MRWLLLLGVWSMYGAFGLVATSLAPLVLAIEDSLDMTHAAMGTVMGAWQLVYIFSAIPCGMLLDRLGSRAALLIGMGCIAASCYARSLAVDFSTLVLAVMLFGLGGPIVSAGAPKVITAHFTGSQRGLAMGIYMTGPSIGGILTLTLTHAWLLPLFDHDWRAVLQLWALVCVGSMVLWFIVTGFERRAETAEPAGAAGLPQGKVLRDLVRQPAVLMVLAMSVGVFLFNHGLNNWLPELLRSGGMSIVHAGYWAAIPTAVGIAGSLLIPRLATPERRFPILFTLSLLAALAAVLLQFDHGMTRFGGLFLQGIARSALMTVLILTLVELPGIGERRAGTASGLFFSAAEVGGVLGPLSLGLMYDLSGNFGPGLLMLTAVAVMLALATTRLAHLAGRRITFGR